MEKDPYLYGLPATAVGTRTRVTAMGIPTVFSHYRYPVQHKEGEFVGISVRKLFYTPLPPGKPGIVRTAAVTVVTEYWITKLLVIVEHVYRIRPRANDKDIVYTCVVRGTCTCNGIRRDVT